jgi:hypothetical protein
VDTGLDQNEAELGVLVLAVALKVLADSDSLIDKSVQHYRVGKMAARTFLINMYRSSGISGARPVVSLRQSKTKQRQYNCII